MLECCLKFFTLLKCLSLFCQILNVKVNACCREVVQNDNSCGCSFWKWCGWLMLNVWFVLWCSVQSGRQRHVLVHHLERLCQCDHTREGNSIHGLHRTETQIQVKFKLTCCVHTGHCDYSPWRRGLWAAGFAERRTSRRHHHLKGGQLPFPPRGQAGFYPHPQGPSRAPAELQLQKHGKAEFYLPSCRMWRPTRCGWRSMGRRCWCWNKALSQRGKEVQEPTASEAKCSSKSIQFVTNTVIVVMDGEI